MKKIISIVFILQFHLGFTQAKITETEKQFAICKAWGFLKYYHPNVANGNFKWDEQLFEVLPKIEQAKTKEEFSLILENWIDSLGEIPKIEPIIQPKEIEFFDKNFDLSWIDKNKLFSEKLSKKLRFIENNRFQGNQFYVDQYEARNVFVKNENQLDSKINTKKTRILALFRYWNLIEYFYPYKYLMDKNWDLSLEEVLPSFIKEQNQDDFEITMKKLTVRLNDSHVDSYHYPTESIEENKRRKFIPAKCKIIDDKIIITGFLNDSLANAEKLKVGDVITKVNGKTIKEIILEYRDLVSGSNESSYFYRVVMYLVSGYSDSIQLEFLKENENITRTIHIYGMGFFHGEMLKKVTIEDKFKLIKNNVGYVNMGLLKVKNVPEMIETLSSTKAIVFDLRNYPKETYDAVSNFLNSNEKPYAIYTKPYLTYPGRFFWSEVSKTGSNNTNNYKGKIILLVNEKTLSQSEWSAMIYQTAGNTTIIGSQTAGADGNVTNVDFVKDYCTLFSGIGVYYPDRGETQRIGIIPNIEIKPTIKGIQEGRDEVLDRALDFIETGK